LSKIGIMQGRLIPQEPGRLQAFPRDGWKQEFTLAAQVPLSYIEWIYDLYGADVNPLTGDVSVLKDTIRSTGITTRSMCADYFMDKPFLRCSEAERLERELFLHRLLRLAERIGIERIVLPFVDASRIESQDEQDAVVEVIHAAVPITRETGVELHLETALQPAVFASLLDRLPDPMVKVNYDSGNSASLGYDPKDEFAAYGSRIGSVHIKDRVRGGGTVPLGTGDADFRAVFSELEKSGYEGDITLQAARSEPGQEVAWARLNREFVARYWPVA
jgi:L-ribulose-5-phosphate 3-epimerase